MLRFVIGLSALALAAIIVAALVVGGDGGSNGSSNSNSSRSTATPPTTRERIEDCLDPWDGNHNGFERQICARLRDPDSISTQETRFGVSPVNGKVPIQLDYTARNGFGGTVRNLAVGQLNISTRAVTVVSYGE